MLRKLCSIIFSAWSKFRFSINQKLIRFLARLIILMTSLLFLKLIFNRSFLTENGQIVTENVFVEET